jgi:DNA recombination-dependent growth factor C
MKASFKACEDTANSLRDTLESLEINAVSLVSIPEAEITARNLHDSVKNNSDDDDNDGSAYRIKFVASLMLIGFQILTV